MIQFRYLIFINVLLTSRFYSNWIFFVILKRFKGLSEYKKCWSPNKDFLPLVANAERIQNMHIRIWSANGWCCIICILWTRTSSFPTASVALTFRICTNVDPLHDVLAWIASRNIRIRLIATEGSFVWKKLKMKIWK